MQPYFTVLNWDLISVFVSNLICIFYSFDLNTMKRREQTLQSTVHTVHVTRHKLKEFPWKKMRHTISPVHVMRKACVLERKDFSSEWRDASQFSQLPNEWETCIHTIPRSVQQKMERTRGKKHKINRVTRVASHQCRERIPQKVCHRKLDP